MNIFNYQNNILLKNGKGIPTISLINSPIISLKMDKKSVGHLLRPRSFTMFAFL